MCTLETHTIAVTGVEPGRIARAHYIGPGEVYGIVSSIIRYKVVTCLTRVTRIPGPGVGLSKGGKPAQADTTQPGVANTCINSAQTPDLEYLLSVRCFDTRSGAISGPWPTVHQDARERLTVRGDAQFYAGRFLGATHQFKFGVTIENENYTRDQTESPRIQYSQGAPADPEDEDALDVIATVDATFFVPETSRVNAKGTNWGLYAEDQFKPAQNLTLTVGLRLDREEIRSEGKSVFDPDAEYVIQESFPPTGVANFVADTEDVCLALTQDLEAETFVTSVSCGPQLEPGDTIDPDEPVVNDLP